MDWMDKSHAVKKLLRFLYLVGQSSMKFLTLYFMLNSGLLFPSHVESTYAVFINSHFDINTHLLSGLCFRRNLSIIFFPFVSPNWDFFMCYVHFNSVNAIVDKIIELLSTYGEHKQCGTNDYIEFTADDDIITNKFFALSQFHLFCTARCYFFVVLLLLLYEHRAVCLYNTNFYFLMMSESTWTFNEIGAVQLNMLVRNKMMNLSLRWL